jgi:hypothetical protein
MTPLPKSSADSVTRPYPRLVDALDRRCMSIHSASAALAVGVGREDERRRGVPCPMPGPLLPRWPQTVAGCLLGPEARDLTLRASTHPRNPSA